MSYIFDWNDETVWSPSLSVGQVYVGVADMLSDLLGVPHGMTAMAEDYYEIDSEDFRAFLIAVRRTYSSGHPLLDSMLQGFIAASAILLGRMGVDMVEAVGRLDEDQLRELSAKMPT